MRCLLILPFVVNALTPESLDEDTCYDHDTDEMSEMQVHVSMLGKVTDATAAKTNSGETSLSQNGLNASLNGEVGTPNCLTSTGGTCTLAQCSSFRGPATCQFPARCMCQPGFCAGADGVCTEGEYKVLLDNFQIKNFRWNKYLYVSRIFDQVGISEKITDASNFKLVETADKRWILYSKKFPDYAIAVTLGADTSTTDSTTYISHKGETYRVTQKHVLGKVGLAPSVDRVALTLSQPPGGYEEESNKERFNGAYPVMLQSHSYSRRYIYSSPFSFYLDVSHDDPGDGAYWVFEPPLNKSYFTGSNSLVEKFQGRRCTFDCHGDWGASHTAIIVAILSVFVLVAIGVGFTIGKRAQ
jgi:hypothetical protein